MVAISPVNTPPDRDPARSRNLGWSWLTMYQPPGKLERVMGIEATPVAWDKLRQWLLPASCRCVLEGLLLAGPRL